MCGHLSGLSTAQNILRAGYLWLSIFKDCIEVVKRCHPCQVFARNMRSKPAPLHPIITAGPFTKWGLNFMDCNPASAGGAQLVDYEGTALAEPRNGIYLKKYYACSSSRANLLYIIVHFA